MRVVHQHAAVLDRQRDDIVIGLDRPRHARLMPEVSHLDRTDPGRTMRQRVVQSFQRLARAAAATAVRTPTQRRQRAVEASVRIPAMGIEQRQRAPSICMPNGLPVANSMTAVDGACSPNIMAKLLA
ncbi:hypothetical protein WJ968_18235 [Achromobacter xylosoxidans]